LTVTPVRAALAVTANKPAKTSARMVFVFIVVFLSEKK